MQPSAAGVRARIDVSEELLRLQRNPIGNDKGTGTGQVVVEVRNVHVNGDVVLVDRFVMDSLGVDRPVPSLRSTLHSAVRVDVFWVSTESAEWTRVYHCEFERERGLAGVVDDGEFKPTPAKQVGFFLHQAAPPLRLAAERADFLFDDPLRVGRSSIARQEAEELKLFEAVEQLLNQ